MSFDWTVSLGNLLSALIIAIGWVVGYHFNSKKDFVNKKREIRIQYLIEAYKVIAASTNRENDSKGDKEFEAAIEQIQFLGTVQQVDLLIRGMSTRNFTPLLEELRKEIRKDLELDFIEEGIKHFRFDKIKTRPNTMQPPAGNNKLEH